MNKSFKNYIPNFLDVIGVFVFSGCFFSYLIINVSTDITTHIEQIRRINANVAHYPANFLFYFIVNLFSGFSQVKILNVVTVLVLSVAVVLKYSLSKRFILNSNPADKEEIKWHKTAYFSIITLALFFCFAIPDPFSLFVLKKMYLSKFVPMVWHNSTTIFLFPFSILLFWKQLKMLNNKNEIVVKDIIIINLLVIVNLLIKPSFILAYAPVTFFFLLNKNAIGNFKSWIIKLTPLFTTVLLLMLQYYFIYVKQAGSFFYEKSELAIGTPFQFLLSIVPGWFIPFSFIFSYAIVIMAIINYKEILSNTAFRYALSLTVFAIFISAFIIETGPRALHGNFLWQNVICTYLLFLSTIAFLTPKLINKQTWNVKDKLTVGLFIAHACAGILYPLKIVFTTSYY
jgi:hypothetical protein